MVVVNPNNPTGSFLRRDEWARLHPVCRERGWVVISDEVFSAYAAQEDPQRVACAAAGSDLLTFSLGGLSKSCGLPQCKLGWIAVGGPDPDVHRAMRRLEVIADTYLSVAAAVQWALPRLLQAGWGLRQQIRDRLAANRAWLGVRTAGTPCRLLPADGGWHAILEIPRTLSEEDWALRILQEDRVILHPGYFYDFPREAYLILSLLPAPETFQEGADRVTARVAREA